VAGRVGGGGLELQRRAHPVQAFHDLRVGQVAEVHRLGRQGDCRARMAGQFQLRGNLGVGSTGRSK
jgi:hypothetical protein